MLSNRVCASQQPRALCRLQDRREWIRNKNVILNRLPFLCKISRWHIVNRVYKIQIGNYVQYIPMAMFIRPHSVARARRSDYGRFEAEDIHTENHTVRSLHCWFQTIARDGTVILSMSHVCDTLKCWKEARARGVRCRLLNFASISMPQCHSHLCCRCLNQFLRCLFLLLYFFFYFLSSFPFVL